MFFVAFVAQFQGSEIKTGHRVSEHMIEPSLALWDQCTARLNLKRTSTLDEWRMLKWSWESGWDCRCGLRVSLKDSPTKEREMEVCPLRIGGGGGGGPAGVREGGGGGLPRLGTSEVVPWVLYGGGGGGGASRPFRDACPGIGGANKGSHVENVKKNDQYANNSKLLFSCTLQQLF